MAGILYFEKDLFLQKYIEQLVVPLGHEINCYEAYEGFEYLIDSVNPDIIIVDEEVDSESLRVKAETSEIPVVFTGFTATNESNFLKKPLCPDELIGLIKGIIKDV